MPGLSIPEDYPLAKLVGQEVTQVCIGTHHIRLNFYKVVRTQPAPPQWEPGAAIDIEAGFKLRQSNGTVLETSNKTLGAFSGCLTALLGQKISSTERLAENELLVRFSNGAELHLVTDRQGFESYHIHIDHDSVDVTKP
jgi:Family of unknown function (DUF6188)